MMTASLPFFDGHNDTLLKMLIYGEKPDRFFAESSDLHISLHKAEQGNLVGGLFAICVPPPELSSGGKEKLKNKTGLNRTRRFQPIGYRHAYDITLKVLRQFFEIKRLSGNKIRIIKSSNDLVEAIENRQFSLVIHFEGAEQIDASMENLEIFYEKGLRSLGIVWSRPNIFGKGVEIRFPGSPNNGEGLTVLGMELVKACNKLGIMVDLSHMTENGFWDVARVTDAPLVASHSCVHNLCNSTRNLTDIQLEAIGESNGLVGVNFAVQFLREDGEKVLDTPAMEIARHIAYIAGKIGPRHVAIGSDFDGATIPNEIGDASGLQNLATALRQTGFNDEELAMISHKNWIRVLKETWRA